MDSSTTTTTSSSSVFQLIPSIHHFIKPSFSFNFPLSSSSLRLRGGIGICSAKEMQRRITSVESCYSYDKPIPEQIIEKPVGLSVGVKHIGDQPGCSHCQAKGAVLCPTCSGSGLYVDSIMECQGILLKVRCLGCGGTGNTMCSECGGRGHL